MEVVQRRQGGAQHLSGHHEMTERAAAEPPPCRARTRLLDWTRITGMAGVADHELAFAREKHAIAAVARGEDAIEEVISHAHEAKQIIRRSDTHEIPGPVRGQTRDRRGRDLARALGRLADAEPTDGIAIEAEADELGGAARAQGLVEPALHDAEKRRVRASSRIATPP